MSPHFGLIGGLHQGSQGDLDLMGTKSRTACWKRSFPDSKRPQGEHSFWNAAFRSTGGRRSKRFGGGDCPFSEYEKGAHSAAGPE